MQVLPGAGLHQIRKLLGAPVRICLLRNPQRLEISLVFWKTLMPELQRASDSGFPHDRSVLCWLPIEDWNTVQLLFSVSFQRHWLGRKSDRLEKTWLRVNRLYLIIIGMFFHTPTSPLALDGLGHGHAYLREKFLKFIQSRSAWLKGSSSLLKGHVLSFKDS